jgi:hypothetical protein
MRDAGAAEEIRFLTGRLNRANTIQRVESELADTLLRALRPFVSGDDPLRASLATAALAALEAQNGITRAVLDDHLCRALEVYLALPTPVGARGKVVYHRRPAMAGERKREVSGHGKGSPDAVAARQEKEIQA